MANLERRQNKQTDPNIFPSELPTPEETLAWMPPEDSLNFQQEDIFHEKKKDIPSLQIKLEEIYSGDDKEKRASLDILYEDIVQRVKLKETVQEALKERRGCRWQLDGYTFGPSIILMSAQLLANSASIHTLYHGGALIAAMASMRLIWEVMDYPTHNDDIKNHRTSYKLFQLTELKVKETGTNLVQHEKIIHKNLELLQLHEMPDNPRKEYNTFEKTLSDIAHFYEQKKLEEELLERARKRLQG